MVTAQIAVIKRCRCCGLEKPADDFSRDASTQDGLTRRCKECNRAATKSWAERNREVLRIKNAAYKKANPEVQKRAKRKHAAKPESKVKRAAYRKKYYEARYRADVLYRLDFIVRGALKRTLLAAKRNKVSLASSSLPYTAEMLRERLEMNFKPGMSWSNHGEWHVDHRVPVARLIRRGVTDAAVINSLSNLCPLWADDNLRKSKR